MKAVKGEEILLTTENKVGTLESVTSAVKGAGVNIRTISAWGVDDKAFFRLVTSDNLKAKKALEPIGAVESKEAIIVEMSDKVGQLHLLAKKLKEAGVDLTHVYGTTYEAGRPAIIVFSSDNNNKALEIISSLS